MKELQFIKLNTNVYFVSLHFRCYIYIQKVKSGQVVLEKKMLMYNGQWLMPVIGHPSDLEDQKIVKKTSFAQACLIIVAIAAQLLAPARWNS